MRPKLQQALDLARTLELEQLPEFLGELEQIRVTAMIRMGNGHQAAPPAEDELLEVAEAAARMSVSIGYLYQHADQFPFVRRIGRKVLFSSTGITAYLRKSR